MNHGDAKKTVDLDWLILIGWNWWVENHPDEPAMDIQQLPNFFDELRAVFDSFNEGNWLSLLDAIQICRDQKLPLPNWVNEGLLHFIVSAVKDEKTGGRGRANSPLGKTKESLKRQKRRNTYRRIRQAQHWHKEHGEIDVMFAVLLPPETTQLFKHSKLTSLGQTVEDALRVTELSLRGTFAQGSFETLKRACKRDYIDDYMVSHETQVALGFASDERPELLGGFEFGFFDYIEPPETDGA